MQMIAEKDERSCPSSLHIRSWKFPLSKVGSTSEFQVSLGNQFVLIFIILFSSYASWSLQLGLVTPGYQKFLGSCSKIFIYIEKTTNASVVRLDACSCYLCPFLQKIKQLTYVITCQWRKTKWFLSVWLLILLQHHFLLEQGPTI